MSGPRPEPPTWELLVFPAALIAVPAVMRYAVKARDDLGQPLAGIIIGLAMFSLAGAVWLSWLWWKRFGTNAKE